MKTISKQTHKTRPCFSARTAISRPCISALLSLAMVFAMCAGLPMTASAASASELASQIRDFNHGGEGKLSARLSTTDSHVVLVTGSVAGAVNTLTLNIGNGITVRWEASYSGEKDTDSNLIVLSGGGTFEVAAGGSVRGYGRMRSINVTGSTTVNISGGAVHCQNRFAIYSAGAIKVNVSGGIVSSEYTAAISLFGSNLNVSGGTVTTSGQGSRAIEMIGPNSTTTVSGGAVISTYGCAIDSIGGSVKVIGGMVCAPGYYAIYAGKIEVTGGFVFGVGDKVGGPNSTNTTLSYELPDGFALVEGSAVVVAWDKSASDTPMYLIGSSTDLLVRPTEDVTVSWAKSGTQNGINYKNDANTGFYKVDGVTLIAAEAAVPPDMGGTMSVSLVEGYAATSTPPPTVIGTPPPTVSKVSGPSQITWDDAAKTVNIAPGLSIGTFEAVLKVANAAGETQFVFTVIVKPNTMGVFSKQRDYYPGMFPDINENEWYGASGLAFIKNAYEYGMVNGYTDGTFQPDANIKLSEVIVLAAKVRHIYNGGNGVLSMDLIPWYKNYVDYAIANGIITATTFSNYDALATRAQMAYIFSRCLPASEFPAQNTVGSLPDVSASTQYRDEIFMLYRAGVIAGNDAQGTFAPNTPITRAMVAGIISHIIIPSTRASGNVYG